MMAKINSTRRCRLLELPPEIRNSIYELVIAMTDTTVDFLDICPPPKDLTLTCKQIDGETRAVY